ncbi:MAG: hypothetical protein Q8N79_02135 [Candidatus Methanoperedens sp.]|nr:hypothetical protein [Candidatus Methanoperedens sp.]
MPINDSHIINNIYILLSTIFSIIKKGDARDALRSAVSELPDAPCYIVLSIDADDIVHIDSDYYLHPEGF